MKHAPKSRLVAGLLCALGLLCAAAPATSAVPTLPTGYIPFIPIVTFPLLIPKPIVATCDLSSGNGGVDWFVTRDLRVTSYLGWSADAITFRYEASATGSYNFRIVIRETDRFGDTITRSELRTVALTGIKNVTSERFVAPAEARSRKKIK